MAAARGPAPQAAPPQADARERLLAAAAAVYAQHGHLGATTRRIAVAASVNEVTLFRLFGTKDALLEEAVRSQAERLVPTPLPADPAHPEREIAAWCAAELTRLRASRELLLQCFAEGGREGAPASSAGATLARAAEELRRYVRRLRTRGMVPDSANTAAAIAMLASVLYSDALAREEIRDVYPSATRAASMYARAFVTTLGIDS